MTSAKRHNQEPEGSERVEFERSPQGAWVAWGITPSGSAFDLWMSENTTVAQFAAKINTQLRNHVVWEPQDRNYILCAAQELLRKANHKRYFWDRVLREMEPKKNPVRWFVGFGPRGARALPWSKGKPTLAEVNRDGNQYTVIEGPFSEEKARTRSRALNAEGHVAPRVGFDAVQARDLRDRRKNTTRRNHHLAVGQHVKLPRGATGVVIASLPRDFYTVQRRPGFVEDLPGSALEPIAPQRRNGMASYRGYPYVSRAGVFTLTVDPRNDGPGPLSFTGVGARKTMERFVDAAQGARRMVANPLLTGPYGGSDDHYTVSYMDGGDRREDRYDDARSAAIGADELRRGGATRVTVKGSTPEATALFREGYGTKAQRLAAVKARTRRNPGWQTALVKLIAPYRIKSIMSSREVLWAAKKLGIPPARVAKEAERLGVVIQAIPNPRKAR